MTSNIAEKSKILIVDDTAFNLKVLSRALENEYIITLAVSGKDALASITTDRPDLILLDIMMPDMDGYEVCQVIKNDPATTQIPIIFLTALTDISAKSKGFAAGAIDYITKPFEILEVKARVNTHVSMQKNIADLKSANNAIEVQRKRMQLELDLGKKIQNNMLPAVFPDNREFDIAAYLKPAKELGGDFYDFFFIDDEHICFCVGDVSGKGVPAALFMAVTKTLIKSFATGELSPAKVLTAVNNQLSLDNSQMMFVSLFVGILHIPTGKLRFSNGGHNAPYRVKKCGAVSEINDKHGMVLGYEIDKEYIESTILLEKGDAIVVYSDGITEAVNEQGDFYNESRLEKSLCVGQPCAKSMNENILYKLDVFVGCEQQADDITLLTLKYNGK